ncbi:MAG TPA: LptA/OstA family protein [Candidatus Atribacteria bacterium]|nr:LptA/OstA family protein [Candidatus Atribacteria bacterium]
MRKIFLEALILAFLFLFSPFLLAQEEETVLITTPQAEYNAETGKIVAQVSTFTWRDVKVVCPFLEIDTKTQEARSEGNINISWGDFQVQAQSLYYQGDKNRLDFSGIKGSNPEMNFSTGEAHFDFNQKKLYLTSSPLLILQGWELRAQGIEYSLEEKTWEAQVVRVEKEAWQGRAEKAFYREEDDFITLEGGAEAQGDGNLLRGEKILIYLDSGRVKVEGNVEIELVP